MVSSIRGGDRDDGGPKLAAAITEARLLFRSCVLPELGSLFEEALGAHGLNERPAPPPPRAPEPPPPPVRAPEPPPPPIAAVHAPEPIPPELPEPELAAPFPITFGDRTEPTGAPVSMGEAATVAAASPPPAEELPVPPIPEISLPQPPPPPSVSPARIWLAVMATVVAATSAGIVYYLLGH
jgi:hypothetical protein